VYKEAPGFRPGPRLLIYMAPCDVASRIRQALAVGDVIHALRRGDQHVPYRNSKLTALLRDSIGGNNKVLVVVACSPLAKSAGESMQSLDFAERISEVVLVGTHGQCSPHHGIPFEQNAFDGVASTIYTVLVRVSIGDGAGRGLITIVESMGWPIHNQPSNLER